MEWELFSDEPGARDFLVAAYDGGRLVGALPSKPVRYQLRGESVWALSEVSSPSTPLMRNRRFPSNWCSNSAAATAVGRRPSLPATDSGRLGRLGQQFWLRLREMHVVGKVGLWVRMIDHRAMSDFLFHPFERRGARVLGWFQGRPKPLVHSAGIRPYRDADLADCLRLATG